MTVRLTIALLLLVLQFATVACALSPLSQGGSPGGSFAPAPGSVRYGGAITIGLSAEPGNLNPLAQDAAAALVSRLVFSGLMRLDAHLQPVPDIAESWSPSLDGLTWTFKLRTNARWHDGVTVTADDVLFSFHVLLDGPPIEDPTLGAAQADIQKIVANVASQGPYVVRLSLRYPFAPLLSDLAFPLLPRHLLADQPLASLAKQTIEVGTGPFRISHFGTDLLTLEAFPLFYLGRPYLDRVSFVTMKKDTQAAEDLAAGRLTLADINRQDSAKLNLEEFSPLDYPESSYYFVAFNLRSGRPFSEVPVRQAWRKAVDSQALVKQALGNTALPTASAIPAYSWAANSIIRVEQRDVAGARSLLIKNGWAPGDDGIFAKHGQRLAGKLYVRDDQPDRVALARAMVAQLRETGIDVAVAASDFNSTMAAARRPPFDFDAMLMGWTVGPDPDDYALFHSSQIPDDVAHDGANFVGFHDDSYDRLTLEARKSLDWSRRAALYKQTQSVLADQLPYYLIWSDVQHWAFYRRLRGIPEPFSPTFWNSAAAWHIDP